MLGLVGSIVLLGDVRRNSSNHDAGDSTSSQPVPTFRGDFAALIGAAAVSVYLVLGRQLREWMPLWIYAFAVKGFAYVTCLVLAAFFDPTPITFWPNDKLISSSSIFGCFVPPFLLYALYLGAGPGVGGHTLLNYLLKYMSPLTISTAMLSEPILGSYMGYLAHLQNLPGIYTWCGGTIVLIGLFLILYGENATPTVTETPPTASPTTTVQQTELHHGAKREIRPLLELASLE
jgi:drug/metabolite transporter (DMT)-like permease